MSAVVSDSEGFVFGLDVGFGDGFGDGLGVGVGPGFGPAPGSPPVAGGTEPAGGPLLPGIHFGVGALSVPSSRLRLLVGVFR